MEGHADLQHNPGPARLRADHGRPSIEVGLKGREGNPTNGTIMTSPHETPRRCFSIVARFWHGGQSGRSTEGRSSNRHATHDVGHMSDLEDQQRHLFGIHRTNPVHHFPHCMHVIEPPRVGRKAIHGCSLSRWVAQGDSFSR